MANIEIFWRQLLISFHDADQINKKMSTILLPNKEQNKSQKTHVLFCTCLMLDLPAKQRSPWDLATTATKMTIMMMMATMTMAITGPVPAERKYDVMRLSIYM